MLLRFPELSLSALRAENQIALRARVECEGAVAVAGSDVVAPPNLDRFGVLSVSTSLRNRPRRPSALPSPEDTAEIVPPVTLS